ncbi:MAG: hypothetical protein J7M05_09405 [Anaerolineae bacterium]|nr:hypothetical protein [Anaerolineae bacterium]
MRTVGRGSFLLAVLSLTLVLTGCQALLTTQEPPVTWVPLPTLGPTLTHTPPPASPTATLTPTPKRSPTPQPSPTATEQPLKERAAWARDRAWEFLRNVLGEELPASPLWVELGQEQLLGATTFRYRAGSWLLQVSVPVVPAERLVYNVSLEGAEDFRWQARIFPDGTVEEILTPTPTPQLVEGWRGTIHSLPEGAQYDDFIRVLGGGQYGLKGETAELERQIESLRDSGRIVQVWGELSQGVEDYGGACLVVKRLVAEPPPTTPAPESELVEGWLGLIRSLPAGAAYDDFFDGQQPRGQYGIDSLNARLREELARYRDSGTLVRVWGVLDFGVDDYGGKRILVTRLEALTTP